MEESTVEDRRQDLLPQDTFIRDKATGCDFIVLSVGGNDIALRPSLKTIWNMATLSRSPYWLINADWAPGMRYFEHLFHSRIEELLTRMLAGHSMPKKVLVA